MLQLDPVAQPDAETMVATARDWIADKLGDTPVVIAASAPPDQVAALQRMLGRDGAGALIEQTLGAALPRTSWRAACAGSSSRVARPRARSSRVWACAACCIGGEIDPGVPWTYAEGGATPLLLALKSGNFGAHDFFLKAFDVPREVGPSPETAHERGCNP